MPTEVQHSPDKGPVCEDLTEFFANRWIDDTGRGFLVTRGKGFLIRFQPGLSASAFERSRYQLCILSMPSIAAYIGENLA